MHPLNLRAKIGVWRQYATRKADPGFRSFMQKVFDRDSYACQFCGFQARDFQDVVNLDHDYTNNKLSNMVTSCCFCAQCFFLESVGVGDYGGGSLVYLPDIPQGKLNSFCHVLFCAIGNETAYKSTAQTIYRSIKFRSQMIEEQFGDGTSDPAVFGQLLIDTGVTDKPETEDILKNLRLLPSRAKFRKQIQRWAQAALEELESEK